jgi:signal transduction histidine kinase/ligand-binding sensor domain-containing protein
MPNDRGAVATLLATAATILCLLPGAGFASGSSRHYRVDVWTTGTTEHDVPRSSTVTSLLQTRDGYLWLGTLRGLVRFDGAQFKLFDENNTPGLASSRIVHLFEDSRSNLWVGTEAAGVALIGAGGVTTLDIGVGGREGKLSATCEDNTGAVWLCTLDGRLYRFADGRLDKWNITVLPSNKPLALVPDPTGLIWLGMDQVLVAFRPSVLAGSSSAFPLEQAVDERKLDFVIASRRGGQWRLADGRVQRWTADGTMQDWGAYPWTSGVLVRAACEDLDGNLVVGTYGSGIYWFDAPGHADCISTTNGLSNDHVLALCLDRDGSLWAGTDTGGLDRIKQQAFGPFEPSATLTVRSIYQDADGGLWFSSEGDGLDYWAHGIMRHPAAEDVDLATGKNLRMDSNYYVRAVLADHDGHIWASTFQDGLFSLGDDGVFHLRWGSRHVNPQISALHVDRAGRLWAGMKGGLVCWDGTNWKTYRSGGLAQDNVRAIADDAGGNIWIGTERSGLKCLRMDQVTSVQPPDAPSIWNVSALYVDKDDVLWIGTSGRGLARLQGGQWKRFTREQGLASDYIDYLVEDHDGCLWLGSNDGLMRVRKQDLDDFAEGSLPCRTYGSEDGLPTAESAGDTQPAACSGSDGRLYFPTIDGLVSVDPAQLKKNTNPPPVVIESVLVEGQEQAATGIRAQAPSSVTIPAGQDRLEIHYSTLNLGAPEKARFKYRLDLEGRAPRWTEVGSLTRANYTKLPHGNYRFQVTACNEDGIWNDTGASIAVVMLPAFWQTWPFLAAVTILVLVLIVSGVHYVSTQRLQRQLAGMRQQQALEDERARIARDIHDQVGASLTQVSLLGELLESDKHQPAEVEAHAHQISQTARETARALDEIVWTVNPSNDTLDGLVNYICKCAQDYLTVAGIRYRLDAPAQLPATPVSPEVRHNVFLAARESVNNIVKHAGASEAWIRLHHEPSRFVLEIQDNGRGPAGAEAPAAQSRNGLRNMRRRMEDVGGSFAIGPAPQGGTLVRLVVPLAKS